MGQPNSEADHIVRSVQSQLETPGRNAEAHAYTQFVTEVDQYAFRHGDDAAKELIADLSSRMQQSGMLPRVAVGWLENDFDKINVDGQDGGLNRSEIERFKHMDRTSSKSDVDAMLAGEITSDNGGHSQFDYLAKRNWLGASDDIIEKCDLRAYDRQQHRAQEREGRHENVRDIAAPLFQGSPPLMAILDASHDGQCDGRVSERDMRRFLTAYEVNNKTDNRGSFPYTDDNAKYVGDLLDGKYPELTGSNFTGFSAQALARRAGLEHVKINSAEDYDALTSAYNSKRPVEELTPPPGEPPCLQKSTADDLKLAPGDQRGAQVLQDDTVSAVQSMSVYQRGDGQWHVAKRLLKAGGAEEVPNKDVWGLTKDLVALNHSHLDKHGKPSPMVHPGETIDVFHHLDDLEKRNPKLAASIESLNQKNEKARAAEAAAEAERLQSM